MDKIFIISFVIILTLHFISCKTENGDNSTTTTVLSPSDLSCADKAPEEQWENLHTGNNNYPQPPPGYDNGSVIGWLNAVNYGVEEGYVIFKSLIVYGTEPNGNRHLITSDIYCKDCDSSNKLWGWHMDKSGWKDPAAWYNENNTSEVEILSDGTFKIPTSLYPSDLWHIWNTDWPRKSVHAGWTYDVVAEVNPVDAGMIQIGFDYWTKTDDGTNIEAANSDWACSNGEWQSLKAGGKK